MSETIESARQSVRDFVMESAQTKGVLSVTDEESLVENGVMDSLEFFRLVGFLEDNLEIVVADKDVQLENFQSVAAILRYVESKLNVSVLV
ncbi:MAG TPA: acyl carrier protein [Candidatus Sulfotelmatobacter sp.]|jgi:acyl carrier protein|nr:acyl carrier protein [Candidatus Sulfotelmatobacter sp.]